MDTNANESQLQQALNLSESFVVEGPVGCGKSSLTVRRYLAALVSATQPEEVLFLAADESSADLVKGQVAGILRGESDDEFGLTGRDAESAWGLLVQPERLQIHTIGSLSLALVEAAPVSSGIGSAARITNDAESYYMGAARALLRTLDHDDNVAPSLETLLLHLDNDLVRAERLIGGMLRRRAGFFRCLDLDDPGQNRELLQSALEDAVVMTLADVSAAIPDDVATELVNIAAHAARQLSIRGSDSALTAWRERRKLPAADTEHLKLWRGLCDLLLDDDDRLRAEFGAEHGFMPPDEADEDLERSVRTELLEQITVLTSRLKELNGLERRLAAVKNLSSVRYTHLQWTVLQSLLTILPRAVRNLTRAFSALGEVDLPEIILGATRALQSGQASIFGTRGLQHMVVDNMADYSFAAMTLLERLSSGWTSLDERSVFITGDAFSSIRRQRGAQPALFVKVLNSGLGKCSLQALRLTDQHRSGQNIVNWINSQFAHETDAFVGEGAMPFIPAVAQSDSAGKVELHAVTHHQTGESTKIVELLRANPDLMTGTTAILLADESGAARIIDALRQAGIRCTGKEVDHLGDRSVIADLHALTRALCHLSDRVAWLSVLRAPWCGLTLSDLHRLSVDSSQMTVWDLLIDEQRRATLSEDGQQRLSRIKRVIAQSLAERGRRDLRRLVEGVWTALGGGVCVRTEHELQNTRDYFRMLERIDDGGEPDSLEALDAAVARLCAKTHDGPVLAGEVFLTTLNTIEQQEFDTVILAGLSSGIPLPEDDDALRWLIRPDQSGNAQLLLAPVSGEGGGDAINSWLKSLQVSLHENELRRLFYTGAARANKQLHVILRLDHDDGGWKRPDALSPAAAMWVELSPQLPPVPLVDDSAIDNTQQGQMIRRLPSSWLLPESPQPKTWRVRKTRAHLVDNEPEILGEDARVVARVLRRTLADCASLGSVEWAMRSLDGLENSFQQLFAMMGVGIREVPDLADRAGLAVRKMLEDEKAQWLLDCSHKNSQSPLRLTGWLDEELVDLDIDRSFQDSKGHQWLVGYYFPELQSGDRQLSIEEIVETQRQSWEDRAKLARRYDPTPVRIGFYFPFSTEWREWNPEN
ncbi:MAG: UvrD-helicase domain-containing protein [Gammaproteobacteria bacterium]|nr:UvrD-helicase domain-containing protein [Gammaproteobacteria bacterium]